MFLFDLYVLSTARRRETVKAFLVDYTKDMEEAAAEYPFPQFADRHSNVYHDLGSLVDDLLDDSMMSYSLYFTTRRSGDPIRSAMLFFTKDGCLIAGLTAACGQDQLSGYLQQLANCVNGEYGYAAVETAPPLSKVEFVTEAERSPFPVFRSPFHS